MLYLTQDLNLIPISLGWTSSTYTGTIDETWRVQGLGQTWTREYISSVDKFYNTWTGFLILQRVKVHGEHTSISLQNDRSYYCSYEWGTCNAYAHLYPHSLFVTSATITLTNEKQSFSCTDSFKGHSVTLCIVTSPNSISHFGLGVQQEHAVYH